jgi:hypothetical protein
MSITLLFSAKQISINLVLTFVEMCRVLVSNRIYHSVSGRRVRTFPHMEIRKFLLKI